MANKGPNYRKPGSVRPIPGRPPGAYQIPTADPEELLRRYQGEHNRYRKVRNPVDEDGFKKCYRCGLVKFAMVAFVWSESKNRYRGWCRVCNNEFGHARKRAKTTNEKTRLIEDAKKFLAGEDGQRADH